MVLQQFFNDGSVWMDLAERFQLLSVVGRRAPSTAIKEQIERLCPQWRLQAFAETNYSLDGGSCTETDHFMIIRGSDCSICLSCH
jgi:hypothetical protein